jgi:hypothetical protein
MPTSGSEYVEILAYVYSTLRGCDVIRISQCRTDHFCVRFVIVKKTTITINVLLARDAV